MLMRHLLEREVLPLPLPLPPPPPPVLLAVLLSLLATDPRRDLRTDGPALSKRLCMRELRHLSERKCSMTGMLPGSTFFTNKASTLYSMGSKK
jgi:hypothetical protein